MIGTLGWWLGGAETTTQAHQTRGAERMVGGGGGGRFPPHSTPLPRLLFPDSMPQARVFRKVKQYFLASCTT
jgi:hypothetical protein